MSTFSQQMKAYQQRVDDALLLKLPADKNNRTQLQAAMKYAVTNGGKRIRPVLTYATGRALGIEQSRLDTPACAVEMMHAYSLVHDDLPAMDDDDLRRGKPTCHKHFDEATAILAGDALQALAFTILAQNDDPQLPSDHKLHMIEELGAASGAEGMAEGQAIDLEAVGKMLELHELEDMHRHKTGALIRASVQLAAWCSTEVTEAVKIRLDNYASAVGLSFQIVDDILDVVGDTETLGKSQGADIARNKPTYPALLGLDGAQQHAQDMHDLACEALGGLGESFNELRDLSAYVLSRSH